MKKALGRFGIYAETGDRRLAFVLPFGDAVLVGTTDEEWIGDPATAVASDEELSYLLTVVEGVFGLKLTRDDIESHYSGVRPLPRTNDTSNAAISRDHSLTEHRLHGVPMITLVGGKLTTFRSVAQQIADRIIRNLRRTRSQSTDHRVIIGGENFPVDDESRNTLWLQWTKEYKTSVEEIADLWPLYGMQIPQILRQVSELPYIPVAGTNLSQRVVRWVIENEWIGTTNPLDDLVERRLMLIFAPNLSLATLKDLAEVLVLCQRLTPDAVGTTIEATRERLRRHYGRNLV